jgi:4'-phosphopantetheinyl transferase
MTIDRQSRDTNAPSSRLAATKAGPAPGISLWLAGPDAAPLFDPMAQSPANQARWRKLHTERRRRDWAVSRALLAGISPPAEAPQSLSHSGGHAALAVAPPGIAVGVDLEFERPRDVLGIARLAFTARECQFLDRLPQAECFSHFYILWTLKEAFSKALDLDLSVILRDCEIYRNDGRWRADVPTNRSWAADAFSPAPGWTLSIVRIAPDNLFESALSVSLSDWPARQPIAWTPRLSLRSAAVRAPA